LEFLSFYHHESCGQCTPCREGTGWLEKVLHRIETGFGREEDIDLLEHPIKKRKHDLSFRRRSFMGSSVYVTLEKNLNTMFVFLRIKNRDHFVAEPFEKVKHLVKSSLKCLRFKV
jgi:NADH-quinone oxidoreductase subunit F